MTMWLKALLSLSFLILAWPALAQPSLPAELQEDLNSYHEYFDRLDGEARGRIAENLSLRIFKLFPEPAYELALNQLKANYLSSPESSEYLARLLHNIWLSRWGKAGLTPRRLDQAGKMGTLGFLLTALTPANKVGAWARYARSARDLFLPASMATATVHFEIPRSVPTPPMAYFDFPIPAEAKEADLTAAYNELMAEMMGLGVATGLTRIALTAKEGAQVVSRGAWYSSRAYLPLLLIAVLSYGVSEGLAQGLNAYNYNSLYEEWGHAKSLMQKGYTGARLESFVQASRRLAFAMFRPLFELKSRSQMEHELFSEELYRELALREEVLAILNDYAYGNSPFYGLSFQSSSSSAQLLAEEFYSRARYQIRPEQFQQKQALQELARQKDLALRDLAKQEAQKIESAMEAFKLESAQRNEQNRRLTEENLKRDLKKLLFHGESSHCQYEFQKYEYLLHLQVGTAFPESKKMALIALSRQQAPTSDLDQKLAGGLVASSYSPEIGEEFNKLKSRWRSDMEQGKLCSHGLLFLTQVSEFLHGEGNPQMRLASYQLEELLAAQKGLVESILY